MTIDRKSFLSKAALGVAALGALPNRGEAAELQGQGMAWLDAVAPKAHAVFMDCGRFFPDGTPFRRAETLLRVLPESHGAKVSEIGIAMGFHGPGLASVISVEGWREFGLNDWLAPQLSTKEAADLASAAEPPAQAAQAAIGRLRERGVRILACNETIGRWGARIAREKRIEVPAAVEAVRSQIRTGVEIVPSMLAAAVLGQERGLRYVSVA